MIPGFQVEKVEAAFFDWLVQVFQGNFGDSIAFPDHSVKYCHKTGTPDMYISS